METTNVASPEPAASISPLLGLLIIGALVLVLGGYFMLVLAAGSKEQWAGFLFVTFWAGREEMKFEELPKCICGAVFGIFLAYLVQVLPQQMGPIGALVGLGVILVAVYCQIMGWFPLVVNVVAMLFLTAGAIPHVTAHADFMGVAIALVLGILYFSGLVWLFGFFQKKQAAAA